MTREQKVNKVKELNEKICALLDKVIKSDLEIERLAYRDKMVLLQWERDILINTPVDGKDG